MKSLGGGRSLLWPPAPPFSRWSMNSRVCFTQAQSVQYPDARCSSIAERHRRQSFSTITSDIVPKKTNGPKKANGPKRSNAARKPNGHHLAAKCRPPEHPRFDRPQPKGIVKNTFDFGFPPNSLDSPFRHAQVNWPQPGNSEHTFDAVFLRDCCSCERCVDPSTTQKTLESADIPRDISPKSLDRHDDGSVHITWDPDLPGFEDHVSVYDPSFGTKNSTLKSRLEATLNLLDQRVLWGRDTMSQIQLAVDYETYMNSSSTLLSCLRHLFRYGLLFIRSIPSSADAVSCLARRIGPLKETLYGSTWDVRSVPSAKNVAYTSSHLGFHMVRSH